MLYYVGLSCALFVIYRVVDLVLQRYVKYLALKQIPGPECGFWLGQLLAIQRESFMAPHEIWWKALGYDAPLMRYSSLLGGSMVAVFDPGIIKDILTAPASKNDSRFYKNFFFLPAVLGKGLVTTEGEEWMKHRRIIQPAFSVSVLKAAIDASVPSRVVEFLQYWVDAGDGQEIDVGAHLSALTLDVIGDVGFSYNCNGLSDIKAWAESAKKNKESNEKAAPPELTDPLVTSMTALLKPDLLRVISYMSGMGQFDGYLNSKTIRAKKVLDETVDRIIAGAKETQQGTQNCSINGSSSTTKSLLQLLLNAKDPQMKDSKKAALTDLELRDEAKTFLLVCAS